MAREVNMTIHQAYDMAKREMNIVRESIRRIESQSELTDDDELELDRLYQWNEFLSCSQVAISVFITDPWNFEDEEWEEDEYS